MSLVVNLVLALVLTAATNVSNPPNHPQVQAYNYPGCGHAFARHGGIIYDAEAAALANGRTTAFLALHLQGD